MMSSASQAQSVSGVPNLALTPPTTLPEIKDGAALALRVSA
ncbi:hypothetical protein [Ruegeria marisrubri]|nr:hypothetical protein [Ruegeria marisrubri]